MGSLISLLAARRPFGVGLALVLEVGILVGLAELSPSAVIGIPAAVAVAIAGSVAIAYGLLDGALLALAGALAFGFVGGWEAGAVASLAVWPAIVVLAGLVGRRVERQRVAFREVLAAQELERQQLALELHDQTAQELTAAMLRLRGAEQATTPEDAASETAAARELLQDTIRSVRDLAVELRPKALDDFGLAPALARLADTVSERNDLDVEIHAGALPTLPRELELTLYRIVQDVLASAVEDGSARVRVRLERRHALLLVLAEKTRAPAAGHDTVDARLAHVAERARLLGGRYAATADGAVTTLRIELPAWPEGRR